MCRTKKFNEARNHTAFDDAFDGGISLLGQDFPKLGSCTELLLDVVGEDASTHLWELLQNLRSGHAGRGRANLAIRGSILVIRAACIAGRPFPFLELCFQIASLGEILLLLQLANLNLLILATSPQLIAPKLVLAFVRLPTVLWNETGRVAHSKQNVASAFSRCSRCGGCGGRRCKALCAIGFRIPLLGHLP